MFGLTLELGLRTKCQTPEEYTSVSRRIIMALPIASDTSETISPRIRSTGLYGLQSLTRNKKSLAGLIIIGFFVSIAILGFWNVPYSTAGNFPPLLHPSLQHWLGTTDDGQDVLSLFIQGTKTTLVVALTAGLAASALSVIVGLFSGYFGGVIDEALQMIVNVFLVIPGLPLMVVLASYITFGGDLPIILVVALTGWAFGARVLRAQILPLRQGTYVEAAKMSGQSSWAIVLKEIMPNMWSLIFANTLYSVVYAILSAASLQFLGLGNLSINSWGSMLYWAQNDGALTTGAWWWFVPPGLAIALIGTGLTFINYGMDDITNPRLKAAR